MDDSSKDPKIAGLPKCRLRGVIMQFNTTLTVILTIGTALASQVNAAQAIAVPGDYPTIQEAVDAAFPGQAIEVAAGEWKGAEIWQPVKIKGEGRDTRIVEGVTLFDNGFAIYSDGTEISHMTIGNTTFGVFVVFNADNVTLSHIDFSGCELCIFSEGNGLTVTHSKFELREAYGPSDSVGGISIVGSNGAFAHNEIEISLNGLFRATAAIGLSTFGLLVNNNIIEHNKISWSAPNMSFTLSAPIVALDFSGAR